MDTTETKILQKVIERYITKHINLVELAQYFSKKISDYGLIDLETSLPFRIIPTDICDEDGDLTCQLHLAIDHPMYGYFSIELVNEQCAVTCSTLYNKEFFVCSYEECDQWLDSLNFEMDEFYKLSSAAAEGMLIYCEMYLNRLIEAYKELIKPSLQTIKALIHDNAKIAISTGDNYRLIKDAKKDFSRALQLPGSWVVFKSLDDLPDEGEPIEEYVDEKATDKLFKKLNQFYKEETYLAAPLYLAQRIILQSGLGVEGFSVTEDSWVAATRSEEFGEHVLPVIDIDAFRCV